MECCSGNILIYRIPAAFTTRSRILAPSAGTPVLFAVDLLDIPEETHGRWIRHKLSAGVRPLGLLGFEARLALRYGEGSERLERRRSLWQAFAQAEGLQYLQPHDILSPSA